MIRLEQFDRSCYDDLISWIDTPEALMQFAGPAFKFPLTKEQLDQSLSDRNRIAFKVIDTGSNTFIGCAEIYLTEKSAYLGRILIGDKQLRGKGVGKVIVDELLNFAFKVLSQSEVQLNVFDWNTAAIKCYEKAGFVLDPDKKLEREVNGQTWIALNMRIDYSSWEKIAS